MTFTMEEAADTCSDLTLLMVEHIGREEQRGLLVQEGVTNVIMLVDPHNINGSDLDPSTHFNTPYCVNEVDGHASVAINNDLLCILQHRRQVEQRLGP